MAAVARAQQNAILGLAVQQVLAQHGSGQGLKVPEHEVYEEHFAQVSGGGGPVAVEHVRAHFSSLLQGDAFDAILEHCCAEQGGVGNELSKEQFLAITHLISLTLQAAQNSDALWAEPAVPAHPPTAHKKRHPTVQEALGERIKAHWGQEGEDVPPASSTPARSAAASVASGAEASPALGKQQAPAPCDSGDKENVSGVANNSTPTGPLEEGAATLAASASRAASPGRQQVLRELGPQNAAAAAPDQLGSDGSADITEFERKLADLMRRMQQDQARLQGKAASGGSDGSDEGRPAPSPSFEAQQAAAGAAPAGRPGLDVGWESFSRETSPTHLPSGGTAFGDFPASTSPLAEGGAAAAFDDFSTSFFGSLPQPSPFSELNPLRPGQPAAETGLPMGLAASGYASPAGALVPQQEAAPLYSTPLAGYHAFATPDQRGQGVQRGEANPAAALDPAALAAAMQQLSLQQALAAQLAASGPQSVRAPVLSPSDPATAVAIARAQQQLEAAAASLVAAATGAGRPGAMPDLTSPAERADSVERNNSGGAEARHAPFTARDHHVHANAPRLGRHLSAPTSHALGPLGAGEHLLQPRPSRLSQQSPASAPGSAPLTARGPGAEPAVQPLPAEDVERCERMFAAKGYEALGGMGKPDAQQLFSRLQLAPHLFGQAWAAADMDSDGVLSKQEFCLYMALLRMAQKGSALPARLSPDHAAALLGQALPEGSASAQPEQPPIKVDLARIRSALRPGRHQRAAQAREEAAAEGAGTLLLQHGDQDGFSDSDDDSGFDTMSMSSRCSSRMTGAPHHHAAPRGGPSNLSRPSLQPTLSTLPSFGGADGMGHLRLAISIRGAEIRYSKPLEKPFFSISVHDSLLRTVELPQDTPPGHYRKETHLITLNHQVDLQTPLCQMPRGSVLYIELRHFKAREGRMSTLAWSYVPLEKIVDFGPVVNRVREGPLGLALYRKPLDLSLRRLKKLGRSDDLRLTVLGLA